MNMCHSWIARMLLAFVFSLAVWFSRGFNAVDWLSGKKQGQSGRGLLTGTDVVESSEFLRLDNSPKGAGTLSPSTLSEYLEALHTVLDRATDPSTNTVQTETNGGTGRVFQLQVTPRKWWTFLWGGWSSSFVFQSTFQDVSQAQIDFIFALYDEDNFSRFLDPTWVEGSKRTLRDNLSDRLGGDIERGELSRQEFAFIPGFSLLDRELVFLSGRKKKGDCTLLGNPSVSDSWIKKNLGLEAWWKSMIIAQRVRAQNLFPSGDRICIYDFGSARGITLEHMITTELGGVLFAPFFRLGLFNQQQIEAYRTEAQKLEDILPAIV